MILSWGNQLPLAQEAFKPKHVYLTYSFSETLYVHVSLLLWHTSYGMLESVLSYHHCHGYLIIITVCMCCYNTIVDVISKFPKAK